MIDAMTLRSIRSADNDTLNAMVKEINARRSVVQKQLGSKFTVGQMVEFNSKKGVVERGEIEKINSKTISVRTAPLVRWRVAPSLLRAA
jgi:uncharacterized protein YkvS